MLHQRLSIGIGGQHLAHMVQKRAHFFVYLACRTGKIGAQYFCVCKVVLQQVLFIAQPLYARMVLGVAPGCSRQLVTRQPLLAPVQQGAQIGVLKLSIDDRSWGEFPVYAKETVPLAGIFGRAWDTLWIWLQ